MARLAGEALAKVKNATAIDAFVMASAALRGDVVYTTDIEDLERLRAFFPGVRLLSI
jgi:hypothetical protein